MYTRLFYIYFFICCTSIYVKLEGLKVFLKDFGNMKDKDSNELILWEDYMIYSVLFRINKDAINKYSKYINLQ